VYFIAHNWRLFCIGAVLATGIGIAIESAVDHRNTSNFIDAMVRIHAAQLRKEGPEEISFLAQNSTAMSRMMSGMTIEPTGDVDRDFVMMMSAHHQGAIDMAQALLRYGHSESLRRLAQEIIVTQQEEISAMELAVGARLPPSMPAPDQIPAQAELTRR
jgi:Domain of unknown function (DUF305)